MGVPPEVLVQVYSGVDRLVTSGAPPWVAGRELMPSSFTHREVLVTWLLLPEVSIVTFSLSGLSSISSKETTPMDPPVPEELTVVILRTYLPCKSMGLMHFSWVGDMVGVPLGDSDGDADGTPEGLEDGDGDGSAEGLAEGAE